MIKVKITTSFPAWPLLRQTPGWSGQWGSCQFYVNDESIDECDFWVVYDGLTKKQTATCPQGNLIFVASEPPDIKKYQPAFLAQFSTVISCDSSIQHPNLHLIQQSLPWMIGVKQSPMGPECVMDYDQLANGHPPRKTKLLSVMVTRKATTAGHRARLAFVEKLLERYGPGIDVFGRGFREIEDKWDAIAPYKYHLVLENSRLNDYFTEKLTDAFLGLAHPIYWGCPNLADYFPEGSFSPIDLSDPGAVESVIHSGAYEASLNVLQASRSLVLEKYNLFAFLSNMIESALDHQPKSRRIVTLCPEGPSCTYFGKAINRLIGRG